MIHYLNLHDAPFQSIKNKLKTIEMRLNDERRKLINVGDIIVFTNNVTNETMSCKVINIYPFKIYPTRFFTLKYIFLNYSVIYAFISH